MLAAANIRDRVNRTRSVHCGVPCYSQLHMKQFRPIKYKPWDDDSMQKALEAVTDDGLSVRRAAIEYGVPRSTLGDRVSGRVCHGIVSGPPRYLSEQEEEELVKFLLGCASVGYPKTRKEVLALVQMQVLRSRGINRPVSHGWWDGFCKRNPNLTFRTPTPLSTFRGSAVDPDSLGRYFDLLERTLKDNGLEEKPCQVFNMDETGMPLNPHPPKCVFSRGEKNPVSVCSGEKTQITVVGCVSAAGYCIPPMVIWDRKQLSLELTTGEVPGTFYGLSMKGWMDQELFDGWLSGHFLRYAPPDRPLLLLVDGHSSHYCPSAIRFAAKEQIIIFALPPHTTHLTQPLDRGCFSPLKMAWREVCHKFMVENPGKRITRFNFSHLFCSAWMKSMTMKNIVSGFRVTGVFPVNRNIVKLSKEESQPSLTEATGLAYIPLYSPAKRPSQVQEEKEPEFSMDELEHFEHRYENGYDIKTDSRYNRWLKMYHPAECEMQNQEEVLMSNQCQKSEWQKLLTVPDPVTAKSYKPKHSGRVLTGSDFLQQMREKEDKKREDELRKEERKHAREKKAKERAELTERKAREREERKKKKFQFQSTNATMLNSSTQENLEEDISPPSPSPDYSFASTPSDLVAAGCLNKASTDCQCGEGIIFH